jgi:Co/Zn/Cd efflux system component/predicted transcriptional regulator
VKKPTLPSTYQAKNSNLCLIITCYFEREKSKKMPSSVGVVVTAVAATYTYSIFARKVLSRVYMFTNYQQVGDISLSRKRRRHGDFYKFILLALMKKGPLNVDELENMKSVLISQFEMVGTQFGSRIVSSLFFKFGRPAAIRRSRIKQKKSDQQIDIKFECNDLQEKGFVLKNQRGKYELTAEGEEQAKEFENGLTKGANFLESQVLGPSSAVRNTFIVDLLLASLKLFSGVFSGSVGLLADGADATVDTASAAVVWLGMRIKRENFGTLIVLLMMFLTGISIAYDSIISLVEAFFRNLSPLAMPYLVIITEIIALIAAVFLFFYQRFVGKRNGSLALISQSIDSKNHIYVAAAVIIGAIFSIFGIDFVDAIIGGFVGMKILIDGLGLSKEIFASIKGEKVDLGKYEVPFERHWRMSKIETFRTWILYSVKELKSKTRNEIVNELKHTFKPEYIPILTEYKFRLGEGFDFEESFDTLVNPLLENNLLAEQNGNFLITDKGVKHVTELTKNLRFLQ